MHIMERQSQLHKKTVCRIGILLAVATLLAGCGTGHQDVNIDQSSLAIPSFTYSTVTGAIWQVDINGYKTQLLPDDNLQKWRLSWSPDHQRLAFILREYVRGEVGKSNETLFMINADGANLRQIIGPEREVQYNWIDNHIVEVWLAHKVSNDTERQQWEQFWIDVETGTERPKEQETSTPSSVKMSPDHHWALFFEDVGRERYVHLLDENKDVITTIYKGPAGQDVASHWSPSSRYVLLSSYTSQGTDDIYVYDTTTGNVININSLAGQESPFMVQAPRWSLTEKWIFFTLDTRARVGQPCLVYVPLGSTQCFDISPKTDQFVWSTDGRYLAFLGTRGDNPVDIYVIDAAAGKLTNLTQDGNDSIEEWIAP